MRGNNGHLVENGPTMMIYWECFQIVQLVWINVNPVREHITQNESQQLCTLYEMSLVYPGIFRRKQTGLHLKRVTKANLCSTVV